MDEEKGDTQNGVVYRLWFCNEPSKSYVGVTKYSLPIRLRQHIKNASKGQASYLYNAIRCHGVENLRSELLFQGAIQDEKELFDKETSFIKELNTISPNGYNMTFGGDGVMHTEELRELKRQLALKQHQDPLKRANWQKGIDACFTEDKKKEISARFKKRYEDPKYMQRWKESCERARTPEYKEKIRKHARKHILAYMEKKYGTTEEREERKALKWAESRVRKQQFLDNAGKKTECITTGIIYKSCSEAARCEGCSKSGATAVANGRQKSTRGKVFRYVE